MKVINGRQAVQRTVLLVGEGYAEVAFIQHLKWLYVGRRSGLAITVKNAYGKDALNVVQVAIRHARNAAFDVKAALLDTDAGWDEKTQTLARKEKIQVVPCRPCLEAMLLALYGEVKQAQSTALHKQAFQSRFGKPANDTSLYTKHFPKEFLEDARTRSAALESLLALLTSTSK